jgi:hypothetical protein
MKSYWRFTLILAFGMILGAISMHWYETKRCQETLGRTLDLWGFGVSTGKIIFEVNTLIELRRGQTDYVIDSLERDLSADIQLLILGFPEKAMSDTNSLGILRTAARYRFEHPYKTGDDQRDKSVEETLSRMEFSHK